MNNKSSLISVCCAFLLALAAAMLPPFSVKAMTRTLEDRPAIVVTSFGTTTKARDTYAFFEEQLRRELPEKFRDLRIEWAFSSEIVRERANARVLKEGGGERMRSLPQVLADLEDAGFRKIAVLPLHIFPGQEFIELERQVAAFRTLGLRIEHSGVLLDRWEQVFEVVELLSPHFLAAAEGCNVLIAHGTPRTEPGSNATYLGFDRYLSHRYPHVFAAGVDGVLTREQALDKAKACEPKRVRLLPFMFVAGDHMMNDIMAPEPDRNGDLSWALELERAGLAVDAARYRYRDEEYFRGLGFYPEINRLFISALTEALNRLERL